MLPIKSGSGINNPDHFSESLETLFWVKILKFFDADPGWKNSDPVSRIRDKHAFRIRNTVVLLIGMSV
jgi:hypothetical protein